jgi:ubiquinone/menaquinone biosynthesis C-methylase UbiE
MKVESIRAHFDTLAPEYDRWKKKNWFYQETLKRFLAEHIPPGQRVLELGCGTGEMLHSVQPKVGVGIDFSENMVRIASQKYPQYRFIPAQAEHLPMKETFDYIIVVDLLDHIVDIWDLFKSLPKCMNENTKVVLTTISPLWSPLFDVAEKLHFKTPEGPNNFIPLPVLDSVLDACGFRVVEKGSKMLLPRPLRGLSRYVNDRLENLPGLRALAMVNYLIFELDPKAEESHDYSCTVVVPCYNEQDNIEDCVSRIPNVGKDTEILIVDDGSKDGTREVAEEIARRDERVRVISYQPNRGKGHAVNTGFQNARGDVIMICDADMAVRPEELPRFFHPLNIDRATFVNGTRMIYPMQDQAMRGLHLLGNKIFGLILSWLIGQQISDSLCGTKALLKKDFANITMGRCQWGDFDLLFGAAKQRLKIIDIPVHYQRRIAGESKMKTFKHGFFLLRMCGRGFVELKLRSVKK